MSAPPSASAPLAAGAAQTAQGATIIDVRLPNDAHMPVVVQVGDNPVSVVKRAVSARLGVSPLLQRVSRVDEHSGVDCLSTELAVKVVVRPARVPSATLRVQLMSEQRVTGVSCWDVSVDPLSDSVADIKFLLSETPALRAAGIRPEWMRLYVRAAGQRSMAQLNDSQTIAAGGLLSLPAGRVVRVQFELPSGVAGHGLIHATRQTLNERTNAQLHSMGDIFLATVRSSPNKPFLGTRSYPKPETPAVRGEYEWITYGQAGVRVGNLGAGLRALGLNQKETIGIVSANRTEWVLVDQTCNVQGFVSVPLYDTLGPDAIQFIINHSNIRCVFASTKELKSLASIRASCPSLEFVVVMDDTKLDALNLSKGVVTKELYTHRMSELEKFGAKNLDKFPAGVCHTTANDVLTICYTSGTTGNPKGAVLTHGNIVAGCAGIDERAPPEEKTGEEVAFSYLPLAHIYERVLHASSISNGGAIGFSQGDPVKLLEDVQQLKPTIFPGVPRVWQRIYDRVFAQVASSGFIKSTLFHQAFNNKIHKLHKGELDLDGIVRSAGWDKIVFKNVQALFGGRVKLMASGAAPLSSKVGEFMRAVFGANFVEGYGLTETAAALTCSSRDDCTYGSVGSPLDCNLVKLVDVPDMEYLSSDKPNPRGEIWVCGANVFQGYYKLPEVTAEVFETDPQGRKWFKTGDVGMWLPDGSLKIIDRKKNLFKLSQGEYIRPEAIEGVYKSNVPALANIFVHGESSENWLVAVVYPEAEALKAFAAQNGIKGSSHAEWVKDPRVNTWLLGAMDAAGKKEKLRGFEFVKKIHVSAEDFTVDNGLLTPTFKLKRNVAAKYFGEHIKKMYKEGEAKVQQIKAKL